ncbi:MAG: HD domain-containing phosphohydrolase [Candidatus Symbiobacter sp.]|nr:HD domain-containing phosphohydrolase [Candidatus Symbiobacter sp.]
MSFFHPRHHNNMPQAQRTPQLAQNLIQNAIGAEVLAKLIELGIALSGEHNRDRLMERILLAAKELTHADGGTLYVLHDPENLGFAILRNDRLGTAMGGTTGKPITFPPLKMYKPDGKQNINNVATAALNLRKVINIPDAYFATDFDFSGTKIFDHNTGYRSKSMLAVPLFDHEGDGIGVVQLINAIDPVTREVVPFNDNIVPMIESLASQAAIALSNDKLMLEQRNLIDALVRMMANAIDRKSAYTGGHCNRVPIIMNMLAHAACDAKNGYFADFALSEDQFYEIQVAGGLHDVGKVVTPVHIMDKGTKLEKICDRIDEIRVRFDLMHRDAEIEFWKELAYGKNKDVAASILAAKKAELDSDLAVIEKCNIGSDHLAKELQEKLKLIKTKTYLRDGKLCPVITEDEYNNLSIVYGTLNNNDRKVINDHIVVTIEMLQSLPLPRNLKNVVEIAGAHHEKMDGTGYPKGLRGEEMSDLARMMCLADVFEALTASDRPYKAPKTMSESLGILVNMVKEHHIDGEIYRLFLESGIWRDYGAKYLRPEQCDVADISGYLQQITQSKAA